MLLGGGVGAGYLKKVFLSMSPLQTKVKGVSPVSEMVRAANAESYFA